MRVKATERYSKEHGYCLDIGDILPRALLLDVFIPWLVAIY